MCYATAHRRKDCHKNQTRKLYSIRPHNDTVIAIMTSCHRITCQLLHLSLLSPYPPFPPRRRPLQREHWAANRRNHVAKRPAAPAPQTTFVPVPRLLLLLPSDSRCTTCRIGVGTG